MKNELSSEEIALIKSAQAGSERAFSQLFYKYKPFVDNLLYTYIKDRDEARDITNIVFLRVKEKLSKFTNYSTFGGWLRILTKNVAIDYLRTVKDSYSLQDEVFVHDVCSDDTEKSYVNKMTYDALLEIMETVPPSYREACMLFYKENMTVAQVSEALGISKGTVKSYLFRLRKILRNKLNLDKHDEPKCINASRTNNLCNSEIQQKQ